MLIMTPTATNNKIENVSIVQIKNVIFAFTLTFRTFRCCILDANESAAKFPGIGSIRLKKK